MYETRAVMREADGSRLLLHRCFEEQARSSPGKVALRSQGDSITYADLEATSNRVAAALRTRGIGEGATVGLHVERSIRYVAALLGVLKAGAAVAPLPPTYPAERLREILAFARFDAVIDDAAAPLEPGLCDCAVFFAELEAGGSELATSSTDDPDRPAFVLCSSGSTGQPKMIVRSHRSFFHRLNWTWTCWPYADGEVCCQKSHMTTTHAVYELFEPLLRGVPVLVIVDEVVRDLETFWDTIREQQVSRLLIVPSMLQASLEMPGFIAPPIRVLVLMGEYLHPRLAGRALQAFSADTRIFSIYGSTEASSTLVCDVRLSYQGETELPLGKPISPMVKPFVLGPDLAPVAAGDSGLLHMAGPALFSGYFRNPSLTESSFIESPAADTRLFNTNDQVRLLPGGDIQYVGRVDQTVKVRGFRLDLGEVERALLKHPGIRFAAATLSGPAAENPLLLAFYAPASADQATVQTFLRGHLPPYMIPSILIGHDALPLTASGKIDRRRLLEEFHLRAATVGSGDSLSGSAAIVADAWRQVLGRVALGAHSSFFEVGGTSLSVFSVVHQLRVTFGLQRDQLSEHSIYQFSTVRELAGYIDEVRAGGKSTLVRPAVAVTLRKGDVARPPLFVIASSGGTLGAYEKLSRTLRTTREIVGIRDPFIWGDRDPTAGFQDWISIYVRTIQERQARGPYFLCAFSSAGAFGCAIAQRLRAQGEVVEELLLIDPIGIGGEADGDFGKQAFEALFAGRRTKLLVRLAGRWRLVTGAGRRSGMEFEKDNFAMTAAEFELRVAAVRQDRKIMKDLSSLFELNTGLPFTMTDADFNGRAPAEYLATFLARVRDVTPDVDPETIERILIQYYCLQLPATHFYRLGSYDGRVEIFEAAGPAVGLLAAYFRPLVKNLRMRTLAVGVPSERTRFVCENLSRSLRTHYRSMRDDTFVAALAAALEPLLEPVVSSLAANPTSRSGPQSPG